MTLGSKKSFVSLHSQKLFFNPPTHLLPTNTPVCTNFAFQIRQFLSRMFCLKTQQLNKRSTLFFQIGGKSCKYWNCNSYFLKWNNRWRFEMDEIIHLCFFSLCKVLPPCVKILNFLNFSWIVTKQAGSTCPTRNKQFKDIFILSL